MNVAGLYPVYWDEIVRFARTMTRDRAGAEDVAQETFVRALQNSALLMELSEPKARAWLYTTAKRIVIDQTRRAQRGRGLITDDRHNDDLSRLEVEGLLGALCEEDRRLVRLRYFEDLNSTEIGELLNLPAATVRTRLRAVSKRLKMLYDE